MDSVPLVVADRLAVELSMATPACARAVRMMTQMAARSSLADGVGQRVEALAGLQPNRFRVAVREQVVAFVLVIQVRLDRMVASIRPRVRNVSAICHPIVRAACHIVRQQRGSGRREAAPRPERCDLQPAERGQHHAGDGDDRGPAQQLEGQRQRQQPDPVARPG